MADDHRLRQFVGGDVLAQLLFGGGQQRAVDGRYAGKAGQGQHVAAARAAIALDGAVPYRSRRRQARDQYHRRPGGVAGDVDLEGRGGDGR